MTKKLTSDCDKDRGEGMGPVQAMLRLRMESVVATSTRLRPARLAR